jgi:hypothetical protein
MFNSHTRELPALCSVSLPQIYRVGCLANNLTTETGLRKLHLYNQTNFIQHSPLRNLLVA